MQAMLSPAGGPDNSKGNPWLELAIALYLPLARAPTNPPPAAPPGAPGGSRKWRQFASTVGPVGTGSFIPYYEKPSGTPALLDRIDEQP